MTADNNDKPIFEHVIRDLFERLEHFEADDGEWHVEQFHVPLGGWSGTFGWAFVCDHPDMIFDEATVSIAVGTYGKQNVQRMLDLGIYVWDGPDTLRRPNHRPPTIATRLDARGWNPDGIIRDMAATPEGSRNAFLFWAALALLEDQDEHDITRADVTEAHERLAVAALDAGLGELEIERTITSAERRYGK